MNKKIKQSKNSIGEQKIKADIILNAWLNYCRQSPVYRAMEYIGLR